MIKGAKNMQSLFGSANALDGNWFHLILMDKHWQMSKAEISKFANDHSGRSEIPIPGTEGVPEDKRYWLGHNRLYLKFLSNKKYSDALAQSFYHFYNDQLDEQSTQWTSVSLLETLKVVMCESATKSLLGTQIMSLNPGFTRCYWEFDPGAGKLVWGLPRWMRPGPYVARERLHAMARKYVESAWEHYDWSKEPESDWEPHWGARLSRESARWLREAGFSNKAAAGHTVGTLFG
jgi:hypothetical protein